MNGSLQNYKHAPNRHIFFQDDIRHHHNDIDAPSVSHTKADIGESSQDKEFSTSHCDLQLLNNSCLVFIQRHPGLTTKTSQTLSIIHTVKPAMHVFSILKIHQRQPDGQLSKRRHIQRNI